MSGIVGSRFNIRGSGLVGSLGTDGQVFTSAGAGKSAVYEDAAGGDNTPIFLIRQASATTGIATSTRTKIDLDTADIDTDSGLDATNKRWTVPAGAGGTYALVYGFRFESGDVFGGIDVNIYKNGTALCGTWGTNVSYNTWSNSFITTLVATDYLELWVRQGSGSNKNASTSDAGLLTYLGGSKLIT